MSHAVTIGFGPCKRHTQNGLTAAADHPDGLCATCRSTITAAVVRQNTYSGSRPLETEVPHRVPNPKGGTGDGSTARKRDRLARFKAELTKSSPRGIRYATPAAIRDAGVAVGVGEKTAKEYRKELLRGSAS